RDDLVTGVQTCALPIYYFSPVAVGHVFANKWDEALNNGAILGMVDFGELDHLQNADQKFWPSVGMSVAQTRNLYGLVYPMAVMRSEERCAGNARSERSM